ncbi:unnamed protein product [Linum tenue]|uniref:Disease resistance N-terminal domain-containing protein n=1 Tax=Linum tenue TaxID=586396 RepID=A0AAV0RM10_9ROSI|nr:unnamed protein product [Linum tenue]
MVKAEAIVSVVLTQLSSITAEELKKHGKLVLGAAKYVEKLKSTFTAIGALLLDAEEKQWKDEGIEKWLKKLEDVSYEIDDVLDEWRTKILKRKLKGGDDDQHARHSSLSSTKSSASSSVLRESFSASTEGLWRRETERELTNCSWSTLLKALYPT